MLISLNGSDKPKEKNCFNLKKSDADQEIEQEMENKIDREFKSGME